MFKLFNRDPYILDKTEVRKERDSETGLCYYVKYNHFIDKRDKNGEILHHYYTCMVAEFDNYNAAKDKSFSFRFNARMDTFLMNRESVEKRHYNFRNQNNILSGGLIWTFSDVLDPSYST